MRSRTHPDQTHSPSNTGPDRRTVLRVMLALAPVPLALRAVAAHADEPVGGPAEAFMRLSRVLAGTDELSPEVAVRVLGLLAERIDGLDAKLADLVAAMDRAGGDRDALIAALDEDGTALAYQLMRPWYLGYVGDPSSTILEDDARFATFLEAQAYSKMIDVVPRPTYLRRGPGWWSAPPPGVEAPPMPEAIGEWTFHPGGPDAIVSPDAAWRAYVASDHSGIKAARAAKPEGAASPGGEDGR